MIRKSLDTIIPSDINMIKSMSHPPEIVEKVLHAAYYSFGFEDMEEAKKKLRINKNFLNEVYRI